VLLCWWTPPSVSFDDHFQPIHLMLQGGGVLPHPGKPAGERQDPGPHAHQPEHDNEMNDLGVEDADVGHAVLRVPRRVNRA